MTGFNVDAMLESARSADWERMNRRTPAAERIGLAVPYMTKAWNRISDAVNNLAEAAGEAEGTSAEDRITSLLNDLENLKCDLRALMDKLEGGRY